MRPTGGFGDNNQICRLRPIVFEREFKRAKFGQLPASPWSENHVLFHSPLQRRSRKWWNRWDSSLIPWISHPDKRRMLPRLHFTWNAWWNMWHRPDLLMELCSVWFSLLYGRCSFTSPLSNVVLRWKGCEKWPNCLDSCKERCPNSV